MELVKVYCLDLPGSTLDESMKDIFRCKFQMTKVNDLYSLLQTRLQEQETRGETVMCILEVRSTSGFTEPEEPKSPVEVAEEPESFEQQFEAKQLSIIDLDSDMETTVNVQADMELLQVDSQVATAPRQAGTYNEAINNPLDRTK